MIKPPIYNPPETMNSLAFQLLVIVSIRPVMGNAQLWRPALISLPVDLIYSYTFNVDQTWGTLSVDPSDTPPKKKVYIIIIPSFVFVLLLCLFRSQVTFLVFLLWIVFFLYYCIVEGSLRLKHFIAVALIVVNMTNKRSWKIATSFV